MVIRGSTKKSAHAVFYFYISELFSRDVSQPETSSRRLWGRGTMLFLSLFTLNSRHPHSSFMPTDVGVGGAEGKGGHQEINLIIVSRFSLNSTSSIHIECPL
jgi:hypothetical protein